MTEQVQSPEYKAWVNMRLRCYNPESRDFRNYGERGITVCDAWRDDFDQFLDDMGERPYGHVPGDWRLDRIDKDGDYMPENCRWAVRSMTVRGNLKRLPRGSKHARAKLNEASVRMLREAQLSTGEKRGVAARLGVTVKALDDAIRGRTWKHVT